MHNNERITVENDSDWQSLKPKLEQAKQCIDAKIHGNNN